MLTHLQGGYVLEIMSGGEETSTVRGKVCTQQSRKEDLSLPLHYSIRSRARAKEPSSLRSLKVNFREQPRIILREKLGRVNLGQPGDSPLIIGPTTPSAENRESLSHPTPSHGGAGCRGVVDLKGTGIGVVFAPILVILSIHL